VYGSYQCVHGHAALIKYLAPTKAPEVKSLLGQKKGDKDGSEASSGSEQDQKPRSLSECPAGSADSASCQAAMDSSLDSSVEEADEALSLKASKVLAEETEEASMAWLPHFKSNMTISMVNEFGMHIANQLSPAWGKTAQIHGEHDVYNPIIHLDEFWLLKVRVSPSSADRSWNDRDGISLSACHQLRCVCVLPGCSGSCSDPAECALEAEGVSLL
jgi:Cleft lip and palate transmembrane protein 1 (CLPTM1)